MKGFLARFSDNPNQPQSQRLSTSVPLDRFATVPPSGRNRLTKRPSNPQAQAAQAARQRVALESTSYRRANKPPSVVNVPAPHSKKHHQRSSTAPQPGYPQQPFPTPAYPQTAYPQAPFPVYAASIQLQPEPQPQARIPVPVPVAVPVPASPSIRTSRDKDRHRSRDSSRDRGPDRTDRSKERDRDRERDRDHDNGVRTYRQDREKDREKRKETRERARELQRDEKTKFSAAEKPSRHEDRGREVSRHEDPRSRDASVVRPTASHLLVVPVPDTRRTPEVESSDSSVAQTSTAVKHRRKTRRHDDLRTPTARISTYVSRGF